MEQKEVLNLYCSQTASSSSESDAFTSCKRDVLHSYALKETTDVGFISVTSLQLVSFKQMSEVHEVHTALRLTLCMFTHLSMCRLFKAVEDRRQTAPEGRNTREKK